MGDFLNAMGIMTIPLVLSSIVAVVVILNLFLTLRRDKVLPDGLGNTALTIAKKGNLTEDQIEGVRESSLLGQILATGLENLGQPRHVMKEALEESGRHVIHSMDKYMTTLGTVAAIAPLLGLLGTVVGMISVFSVITTQGVGSPTELAGGISQALITTAFGISIAVPSLIFHRYFRGLITNYAIEMERESVRLLASGTPLAMTRRVADKVTPQAAAKNSTAHLAAVKAAAAAKAKAQQGASA